MVSVPSSPPATWRSIPDRPRSIGTLIGGFTLLRLLLAAAVPLLPQEAYYWSWSRHLDWSYFDHPPLATYSIALTTALFGQTVFGIKSAAVLWSLGWNLLWARLILDMFGDRRLAFWTLAGLNLTLLYEAYAVGPTPDGPLLFAWSGAIWAVWRLSQTGDGRWWFAVGFFTGLSWLAKYSGVLLLPVVLLYLLASARQRHWLLKSQPYVALLLAVAIFAPVLVWNAQHEWVSLAFQSSRRVGEMRSFTPRHFLALVATQFVMLTPYVFVICFAALFRASREWLSVRLDDRGLLLLLSGAVPILMFTSVSLSSLVKINWLAPAYWSLMILAVHHILGREGGVLRLARGLASSAVILLVAGVLMLVPNLPVAGDLNSWSGWKEAAARIETVAAAERAAGHDAFVFSPNYKISSLIRYYLPGQPRTYAQDVYGAPALQFDYFPLDHVLAGATGILVLSDQDQSELDLGRLKAYFDAVERVDLIEVRAFGKVTRRIEILRCTNYKGHPRQTALRAKASD